MNDKTLNRYDIPVPRYTSYPTAPHFQSGVTADTTLAWLGNITSGDQLSLYFHVPYCAAMCWYCGCHTKVVKRYQPVGDYAKLLEKEISLVSGALKAAPNVSHVHWGGGTPTMLSGDDFSRLMDWARKHFNFADNAEVAVEIDPRTLSTNMATTLARAGVTRASLGVQDFNSHVQKAINRIQPFQVTENAVTSLRAADIKALNFDIMYGLPGQTIDDVIRTIDLAVSLAPERLAVFGYAHVPWMKKHQKMIDEETLPDGPERLGQMAAASQRLQDYGYIAIGLDHFAKPGDSLAEAQKSGQLKRNFQGYTTDQASTMLGFGASSIGSFREGYVQNAAPLGLYRRAVEEGRLPIVRGLEITNDDRLRRAVIEKLMCAQEVDLEKMVKRDNVLETFRSELDTLALMAFDGIVEIKGSHITITPKGRPWMRTVASVFDRYLGAGEARHSRAV